MQDATCLINYDLHWNPVRLMQRIGRVDRRMNLDIEEEMVSDHPMRKADRGRVRFWNFPPPDELNSLFTLAKRVLHKTLRISKTFGVPGGKLLTLTIRTRTYEISFASWTGKRVRWRE
ncbi:MAG: hypothetical protein U0992_00465 [Planctomycetaceae bacterium]